MQTEAIEIKIETTLQIPENFLHLREYFFDRKHHPDTREYLGLSFELKSRYVNPNKVISIRQIKYKGQVDCLEYVTEGNQTFYVEGIL